MVSFIYSFLSTHWTIDGFIIKGYNKRVILSIVTQFDNSCLICTDDLISSEII